MSNKTLIFPCSGAADVGELADRTARKLSKDGDGKIFCLAGIGGGIQSFIDIANGADKILVIDGCPQDCAKKTLDGAGITNIKHARLTDLGYSKGATEISSFTVGHCSEICKGTINS